MSPLIRRDAQTLADLGSGAGFPGLVLAEMLRGRVAVTLYEATAKKCAFLRAAADAHGACRSRSTMPGMEDAAASLLMS